jgi:tRNA threonylcarbamoyladenosine biosynthesis protein TsaE
VSFIEWGERFPDALPADHLAVSLRIASDDSREIELMPNGERSGGLAEAWRAAAGEGRRG